MILVDADRAPSLLITVTRKGKTENTTGRDAVARIAREGSDAIERVLVPLDGPGGVYRLDWLAGDLVANGTDEATYTGEVILDPGTATQETTGAFELIVRPRAVTV